MIVTAPQRPTTTTTKSVRWGTNLEVSAPRTVTFSLPQDNDDDDDVDHDTGGPLTSPGMNFSSESSIDLGALTATVMPRSTPSFLDEQHHKTTTPSNNKRMDSMTRNSSLSFSTTSWWMNSGSQDATTSFGSMSSLIEWEQNQRTCSDTTNSNYRDGSSTRMPSLLLGSLSFENVKEEEEDEDQDQDTEELDAALGRTNATTPTPCGNNEKFLSRHEENLFSTMTLTDDAEEQDMNGI